MNDLSLHELQVIHHALRKFDIREEDKYLLTKFSDRIGVVSDDKSIKPVSPSQLIQDFPEEVIQAFNNLLSAKGNNTSITILKENAVAEILRVFKDSGKEVTENEIYKNNWLDVEETYRRAGWDVHYDGPAYCESYKAFYTFNKK